MITIKRFLADSNKIKPIIALMIFIFGFIAIAPPGAQAAIPRYINYQGKLTDSSDNPVTGDVSITIRIYDAESGGTALWTETQTVTVTNGIFSMLLGNTTALTSLDFNSAYWYSVEVASDGEMTPRQRVTSVAYAINADKLDGYDASQFLRADADTSLTGALTVSGNITGSANGNITLDPTGTGNIVMKIDSTSGDFKVTDGTTNYILVDNATGNVTMSNDLTVSGTIYGTLASTGGNSTFSSIVVTGTSDLRGNISNSGSGGAVTIADSLTQTGSTNQVTFGGNVDANNGLDVTGALTVSGAATLSSALDMNSNIDLDYSGASAALDVTQSSTGPAAQFSGQRVVIGASEASNANALSTGELYVLGDLEVDGTLYANVSSSGSTSLGSTTLSSLSVTGTSDLQGNISSSTGTVTVADYLSVTQTDSSTSGTVVNTAIQPTYQDSGTNSTTAATALKIAPTINYTGATKTGSYTALKIAATETSLPTGTNYLIDAYAGSSGTTQVFYVDNSGNAKIFGTLNMNSQKITSLATPTASTDAATKAYADSLTPASAGGWTDGGTAVYLIASTDNVGIGTANPGAALAVGADAFKVTSAGVVTAGTWNGTAITDAYVSNTLTASDLTASSSVVADAEVDNDITLTNITQITNRSHTSLTDIGTNTHAQIDTHISSTGTSVHGLGSISTQASNNVSITGGSITGITDLAVADGGTGASTAGDARTNLGLGSISTQASNNVSITGGSITGITDLAVADGGTGASTASAALTNLGAAASSHTHGSGDITSGVVLTAPSSAQIIQPSADVVPLTIKGKASAASNVFSIYDAAASPSEKIYVDSAGHMYVAETTTGAAQNSAATMYFGRNSTDNWEVMGYDPTLGTKGKFTFSAPLQVEASSPTGITFIEKDADGVISKSQDFTYDPSADQFSFSGGVFAQQFKNLIKNSSFEAFSALETFHDLDSKYATGNFDTAMGGMRNTSFGYEGGWNNFEPDEWDWVGGDVFQNAPMSYKSGYNVAATTYTNDYTNGVSSVRIKDTNTVNTGTGNDGELKQIISGLEPTKVYSVGIDMRVDPNTAVATKGIVDIVNEMNIAGLTLNGDLTQSTTTITITGDISKLPSNGFLWIEPNTSDAEQVSYTGKNVTNVSGVTRGINGTTARNHSSGAAISCAFRPLEATITNASSFSTFKGQFVTDEMASSVEIHLKAQSASDDGGTVLFDSVQIVAGKSVPEYQSGTITDSGDQTIYGALRIGRASDDKGGILSVDKFVRTRGVEFFTDDPGFTGQKGGFSGFGGINPPVGPYNSSGTVGSLSLFTSGNYTGSTQTMNFYAQITDSVSTPNKFKWYYNDGTGAGYVAGNNDAPINVSTNDITLGTTGVKVRFSAAAGGTSGDRWDFFATQVDSVGGYNSYGTTTTYIPSGTRIFKDPDPWSPTYNELIFEDGTNRVSISSLISLAGEPSKIDPAYAEWNAGTANSGGLSVNTSGNYTGVQEKFYKVQIVTTGTQGSSSGTFKWSSNGGVVWNPASAPYISMSFDEQAIGTEGVRIKFLENPTAGDPPNRLSDAYITGGAAGDTWGFSVHPGSSAGVTAHAHSSSADGGVLNASSNNAASFTIDATNAGLSRSINFGSGVGSASILWDKNLDKFSINNDVDISGTLTATNLSGATSTSGTTNTTFAVDTDADAARTEPIQGAGFIIKGGTGDVNLTYDATNNLLAITGQTGPTDTFVGINIPAGTMYKIGGVNLSAADVGAAVSGHGHAGTDITSGTVSATYLPTAGANTAGIIPSTGLTNAMVSSNVNDAIAWSKISKVGAVASDVGALAVESDPLALKTLDADNIKDTHIDWGTGANQVSTTDMTEGANLYYTDARVDARLDTDQAITGAWVFSPDQITAANTDDKLLSLTQTLNDTSASGGTQAYTGLKVNLTETSKVGWDTVNLMDLQAGSVSKFKVDDAGAVTAASIDLGTGADDDLTATDITDLTDGGSTSLHLHTGLAPGAHAVTHMTGVDGTDKVYWSQLDKANGDATTISGEISAHADLTAAHGATGAVVGTTNTQTLTNKTLTTPKFADLGYIADANGNEILILDTLASAVNELTLANAATAGKPTITATGADNDISINMVPKGAGTVQVGGTAVSLSNHNHSGTYEPVIADGLTTQYWRGDKSWQTLNKSAVGLTNVDDIQQMPLSYLDETTTLGTSDVKVPTQNAVKTYVDANIAGLSWKEAVLDIIENNTLVPPTETNGDRYLLSKTGGAPHANWDGAASGDMVQFNGASWVKRTPIDGDAVFVEDVDTGYVYTGTAWTPFTGTSAYTWGTGLSSSGTTINVNLDSNDLAVDGSDNIYVKDAGIDHDALANFVANEHIDWTSAGSNIVTSGSIQSGKAGTDGALKLYSEQGAADYTMTLAPNDTMTADTTIKLPAAVAASESFLKMGNDGVIDYDTNIYLTAEVDGSTTNEINTFSADAGGSTAGLAVTLAGGGIVTTSRAGDTITITGTEVDGSTTNEINTIAADSGGATTGLAITLAGGTGITTSRAGDTVTVTNSLGTSIESAEIADGTIVSGDIASSAVTKQKLSELAPSADGSGKTLSVSAGDVYVSGNTLKIASAGTANFASGGNCAYTAAASSKYIKGVVMMDSTGALSLVTAGSSEVADRATAEGHTLTYVDGKIPVAEVILYTTGVGPGSIANIEALGGAADTKSYIYRDVRPFLNLGVDSVFKTISVAGQTDVAADSPADQLTLTAGDNITITTNADSDTITITGGGAIHSQNTDTGTSSQTFEIDNDATAGAILSASGLTASDKTFTFPDATGKLVTEAAAQTLTNKTLTTPLVSQIYGSASANGDISIDGTSDTTKTTSYILLQSGGGNVGIGTTAPAQVLDVNGDIIADHIISRGGSPATFQFGTGANAKSLQFDMDTGEFSFTGGKLKQAFQNLVRGGSFESWQTPGWYSYVASYYNYTYSDWYTEAYTSTSYAKFGNKSLFIRDNSSVKTAFKSYYIPNWDRLKGSSVTLSVWARCDSGTATASIGIGTNASNMDATAVNNIALTTTWQNFSFTYSVPLTATTLKVYLYGSEGTNGVPDPSKMSTSGVYYDGVTAVEGNLSMEYGPSPVFDTGDQVIGGSLAIGADINPYDTGYMGSYTYYNYPRIVFGEPDKYFGGLNTAYNYTGDNYYRSYGGGAGEISFRPVYMASGGGSSGSFTFNRPIGMDSYEMSTSSWRTPALFIGRLYDYSGSDTVDKPDYALSTSDAYIKGVVEADGGLYGDIMSFYGGVGKSSNLLSYSQDFLQNNWLRSSNLTVQTGQLAPDGTQTATTLGSSNSNSTTLTQTMSCSGNTTYTFSVYLSPGVQSYAELSLKTNYAYIDANNNSYDGNITDPDNTNGWYLWPKYTYCDLYNTTGWRRFRVTLTTPSGATQIGARIRFWGSSTTNGIKVWGAQLRQASSEGIYIPTTSSPVTSSDALFHGDGSRLTNISASSISGTGAITGITGDTFTINEDISASTTPANNLSLVFKRGNQTDASILWDESQDKFFINQPVNISGGGLTINGTITAGTDSNIITTAVGLLNAAKLSGTVPAGSLPSDGYGSTYVNVSGDTMTGGLNFSNVTADITTAANEHLALMPSGTGNVGIGTTSPGQLLQISGSSSPMIQLVNTAVTGNAEIDINQQGAVDRTRILSFSYGGTNTAIVSSTGTTTGTLRFETYTGSAWNTGMTLNSSGSLGLGTTTIPVSTGINNFYGMSIYNSTAGGRSFMEFGSNQTDSNSTVGGFSVINGSLGTADKRLAMFFAATDGATNKGNMQFVTFNAGATKTPLLLSSSGNVLLSQDGGNVGIGTTSPATKLDVSGALSLASTLKIDATNALVAGGGNILQVGPSSGWSGVGIFGGSGAEVIRISSGNVGIGTTSPASKLHAVYTMQAATGNETAYNLSYTTNKATSGNDTGLLISMTDTLSPGTSNLIDAQAGGVSKFSVDNAGNVISLGTINGQTVGATSSMGTINLSGDLTVGGNFTVNGTQTILNVETVEVESSSIKMNRNITDAPTLNASIVVERGTSADTAIRWNEGSDVWDLTKDGTNYYTILDSNTQAGGDLSGAFSNLQVADDSHAHTSTTLPAATSYLGSTIGTTELEDSAVTSAKINDGAVTTAKIALGAIEKSRILELRPYATTPTANNKVNVAAGIISVANNAKINFAGAISPVFDPVTADSRIDLLTIDSAGTLVIIPGTQAVSPAVPAYPTDKLVIAEVTITETAVQGVSISDSDILDVRPFLNMGSGSGNSSITTTDSVIFTVGTNTDETASNITLAFGSTAGGQKSIIYQGASSDDFVFNDDISLGANTLKFTSNTLTDTKVGDYDSHLINTSNPHSVTAVQIGGTNIITEINAAGTTGTINAARLASEMLTQTEGDLRYLQLSGGTITGDLAVNGAFTPGTIAMPSEANITWGTNGKALLTAEYPNAIIYGDGSNNSGTMAVKNTTDSNWRNYYEWSSQNTVLQDYMITVRYELPQDFSGWALANAIKFGYVTQTALNTDNKADVAIYKAGSASAITSTTANVSTSWSEIVIDDSGLGSWSAGDILIIEIKVYSKNGNFIRVGDITLNYTR